MKIELKFISLERFKLTLLWKKVCPHHDGCYYNKTSKGFKHHTECPRAIKNRPPKNKPEKKSKTPEIPTAKTLPQQTVKQPTIKWDFTQDNYPQSLLCKYIID